MELRYHQKHLGNGIAEYALPMLLVVITAGVLTSLGSLPSLIPSLTSSTNHGTVQQDKIAITSQGIVLREDIPTELLPNYFRSNGITYTKGNQWCLNGQYCMTVPDIAGGPVTEVDGGLGGTTTHRFASMLDALAQQLQDAGYPSDMVNRIAQLANKGHEIGNAELNTIGGVEPKNGHGQDYMCCALSNPRIAQIRQIQNITKEFQSLRQTVNQYLASHPDFSADRPQIIAIIDNAANNIVNISGGVGRAWAKNGKPVDGSAVGYDFKKLDGAMTVNRGHIIHTNANTICHAGKGGKTCLQ